MPAVYLIQALYSDSYDRIAGQDRVPRALCLRSLTERDLNLTTDRLPIVFPVLIDKRHGHFG